MNFPLKILIAHPNPCIHTHAACIFHTDTHTHTHTHTQSILKLNRMLPLQDGYPDLTLVGMLSRAVQMTLAVTPWQAVMATHQVAGMWPLGWQETEGGEGGRGVKDGGKRNKRMWDEK